LLKKVLVLYNTLKSAGKSTKKKKNKENPKNNENPKSE
jgi:hypothetical protein